jgi:hypothetical protein
LAFSVNDKLAFLLYAEATHYTVSTSRFGKSMRFRWQILLIVTPFALVAAVTSAAPDETKAQFETGRKLIAESKCEACHISKSGGVGTGMYLRKDRRVTAKSKLLPQVERCNRELSLGLFPEDEAAIAAYLNAAYYKFGD